MHKPGYLRVKKGYLCVTDVVYVWISITFKRKKVLISHRNIDMLNHIWRLLCHSKQFFLSCLCFGWYVFDQFVNCKILRFDQNEFKGTTFILIGAQCAWKINLMVVKRNEFKMTSIHWDPWGKHLVNSTASLIYHVYNVCYYISKLCLQCLKVVTYRATIIALSVIYNPDTCTVCSILGVYYSP